MTEAVAPRSTWSHWSSPAADDQRVFASPSTALPDGVPAFSADDDVAVRPWERGVSAAVAVIGAGRVTSAAVATSATPRDLSLMRELSAEADRIGQPPDTAA
ncbi:hypothetical protein STENM223S_02840 [Streptomyces tendae]